MKRHLANVERINELNEFRRKRAGVRESKAPENSGLTKEDALKAIRALRTSGHKIPSKLIPKLPS